MVCGTCGKDHRTAECTEDDQERHWCANCKTFGHTSWDQSCPKFTEESKRLKHLNPESMYIYFPTDEPWTWEQLRNLTTSEMGTMTPTQETHDTQNQQHRQETRTNIELTEEHPSEDKAVTRRQTPKRSPTHLLPPYQVKNPTTEYTNMRTWTLTGNTTWVDRE